MAYDEGDLITLTATITDAAGEAIDPSAMVFITKDAKGNLVSYHYSLSDQGDWAASTNTPTLADGTGTAGHYYTNTAAGSVDFGSGSITFAVGDLVFYNGYVWKKLPSPSATTPTKTDTGIYTINTHVQGGTWYCRAECMGDAQAADEDSFKVLTSEF